jgi:hypothetical protein
LPNTEPPASIFLVDMNICYSLLVSPNLSLFRCPWYRLVSSDGRKSTSKSTPELNRCTAVAWRVCFLHTGNFHRRFGNSNISLSETWNLGWLRIHWLASTAYAVLSARKNPRSSSYTSV